MKKIKKLAVLMLALCLVFPVFPMVAEAADGIITFTDPSTQAGQTVEVSCAIRSSEGSVDGFKVSLQYDPAYLTFQGGEGVIETSPGVLEYYGVGGGSNLLRFIMQFQAVQPGTTTIQVVSSSATLTSGELLNCTAGGSTVTIAEGAAEEQPEEAAPEEPEKEESEQKETKVKAGDKKYILAADFDSELIPEGFAEGTVKYKDGEYKAAVSENGKLSLVYLKDADGEGKFFVFDKKEFLPYVPVNVSSASSVILLQNVKDAKIPSTYEKAKLTVDDVDFPAWKDTEHKGFYLVYAMDKNGKKSFYQYNKEEGSYQKFAFTEIFNEEVKEDKGLNPAMILCIILLIALGATVVLLVLKLHRMNREREDMYDKYGIEEDVIRIDSQEEDGFLDEDDSDQNDDSKKSEKEIEDPLDDDMDFDDDLDVDFIDLDE